MLKLLQSEKAAAVSTLAAAQTWLANDASASSGTGPSTGSGTGGMVLVPLAKILDNPYQPRAHYDAEHILNLALSIKAMKGELAATKGLQQVPMARVFVQQQRDGEMIMAASTMYANGTVARLLTKPSGFVQLLFGHSRLRAFMVLAEGLKSLGKGTAIGMDFSAVTETETRFADLLDADLDYTEMPLMLGFALDQAMWAHAITENSQRKNITAIEEAQSIQRAIDEFGLKTEEAGKPFGYARSTTANKLRLLQLPADVRSAIADGRLTERHGRELVRLVDDPDHLAMALDTALKKGSSVRQLTDDVNWRESSMKEQHAAQAEMAAARLALSAGWALPGQSAPVPVTALDASKNHSSAFDSTDAKDNALIEGGHCGPHCACFRIGYHYWIREEHYRPNAEQAPHVCAVCTDYSARVRKKDALPLPAGASPEEIAKRQAAEANRQTAERLTAKSITIWQRWLKEQDLQLLWNDIRFWREAAKYHGLKEALDKCEGPYDGCQEVLRMMYKRTRRWDMELGTEVHQPAEIRALIKALGGSVSRETEREGE